MIPRLRLADVDGPFEAFGQGRGADREGADLRGVGALGGALGVEVGLGFGAGGLAVGGVGVDREAGGRVTVAALISDGEAALVWNWGMFSSRLRPEAESVSVVVGLPAGRV